MPDSARLPSPVVHDKKKTLRTAPARATPTDAAQTIDAVMKQAKQIKQSVVGYGAAAKQQVQHMVTQILKLSATPQEDAADALAAAMVDSRKVVLNLKNTVVFDVLGAEQRNAGIRCMAKIHRMKKMKKTILLSLIMILVSNTRAEFKSEDELSIITTGGNTKQTNYNVASKNSYSWGKEKLTLNGSYSYGKSEGEVDVKNWSVTLRYDHIISSKIDLFIADVYESDQFKGFWKRNNYDLGVKYKFIDKEKYKVFSEIGYRYTEENLVRDTPNIYEQKMRLYLEISKKVLEGASVKFWTEYIPSLESSEKYIVKMEPSATLLLNKTFSLKTAVLWEYENTPVENKDQHDYKTTVSLLANF